MSRRAIKVELQRAIAGLKNDIFAEIQTTISRELSRLELAASTATNAPSSSQAQAPEPAISHAPPTESGAAKPNHQADHMLITEATSKTIGLHH